MATRGRVTSLLARAAALVQHRAAAAVSEPCLLHGHSFARSYGAQALAGKNIFQLRAAVETVEAVEAPQQTQPIALPTSDESEQLLRIRHSVSPGVVHGWVQQQLQAAGMPGIIDTLACQGVWEPAEGCACYYKSPVRCWHLDKWAG
jgi:hypothetical protein